MYSTKLLERIFGSVLIFDCDGVILNSNSIKTNAFRSVGLKYGRAAAEELVKFHTANGGVSRYVKFEHFISKILGKPITYELVQSLCSEYSECLHDELLSCEVAEGLSNLRDRTANIGWMMVSGSDQIELRHLLNAKNLAHFFDKGIFGSPESKEAIFLKKFRTTAKNFRATYIGDSMYDHVVAKKCNLNFVFASDWTEFVEWKEYCKTHKIKIIGKVSDLIKES